MAGGQLFRAKARLQVPADANAELAQLYYVCDLDDLGHKYHRALAWFRRAVAEI